MFGLVGMEVVENYFIFRGDCFGINFSRGNKFIGDVVGVIIFDYLGGIVVIFYFVFGYDLIGFFYLVLMAIVV